MDTDPNANTKDQFGINYRSLDLLNSTKGLFDQNKKGLLLVAAGVIVGVAVILFVQVTLGAILVISSMGYITKLQGDRNKKLWSQFARDNNWTSGPAMAADPYIPPSIALLGRSRKLSDVVQGSYNSNNFRLFTYSYTVGSGKNSTTYVYTVLQLVLQKPLPEFIIDSQRVQGAKSIPSNYEKVSLEGDFDKTFTLYIPKGTSTDALSVISPDVMQTLIDANTMQDIQCGFGSVWFIQSGDTRGKEVLPRLFVAVNSLGAEFYHRLKSYRPSTQQATNSATVLQQLATESSVPISTKGKTITRVMLVFFVIFFLMVLGFIIVISSVVLHSFKAAPYSTSTTTK